LAGLLLVLPWLTSLMNASYGPGTVPHDADSLRALLAACVEDFALRVLRGNRPRAGRCPS
jgi:hypothetical protein